MKAFNDREMKLVQKLKDQPAGSILRIQQACLLHSYCNPLPLFRVHRIDDETFDAQWNDQHKPGIKQVFKFD